MKTLKRFVENLFVSNTKKAFSLLIKCSDCKEEISVRVNSSSDFQVEYAPKNPEHRYTIKKEIIGKGCFNLMHITLALTKSGKVLFTDESGCQFLSFGRE